MRILVIAVMFCMILTKGCGIPTYDDDIAGYEISKYLLGDLEDHKIKPLNRQQIEKMADELIPETVKSQSEEGRVILSSKDEDIMKDFQEYLNEALPTGWNITWSASNADAIITGALFSEISLKVEVEFVERFNVRTEDTEDIEIEPVPKRYSREKNGKAGEVNKALFLFWTVETDPKAKEVRSATDNYEDPNIKAAITDLANNLQEKERLKAKENLKIALINKDGGEKNDDETRLVTAAVLSELVTATIGGEKNDNETKLIFLYKNDTSKHETALRKAFGWVNRKATETQKQLTIDFSDKTGANAVLIIEQLPEGHFDLQLLRLPSLDLLGIGKSNN